MLDVPYTPVAATKPKTLREQAVLVLPPALAEWWFPHTMRMCTLEERERARTEKNKSFRQDVQRDEGAMFFCRMPAFIN